MTTSGAAVIARARRQTLDAGQGLDEADILACLLLPDDDLPELLALAHEVRRTWCGDEVEVEGIVSVKTGGCPEDCHFCSQSGLFDTPVRAARLDIPAMVQAARETRATGATEFCIVAAVRGPDERLLAMSAPGSTRFAPTATTSRSPARWASSLPRSSTTWSRWAYTATTTTSKPLARTSRRWSPRTPGTSGTPPSPWFATPGLEVCCGGILGMGESLEQRAEFAAQLAALAPHEVPLNFLDPRPGTPFGHLHTLSTGEALRAIAAFRLAMPRTILRFAGGREITLGDLGTRDGLLGGVNAIIVGNYLTTLGQPATSDLELLAELRMPIKALSTTL